MTGIVVAGHGSYADGILSAIELVAGKTQEIKGVNFTKGQGVEELRENLKWAITCLEAQEILIMVDILGGSPFNVAVQLMAEGVGKRMRLVAGVNMAAVVQAMYGRELYSFDELVPLVVREGKGGILEVPELTA